MSTEALPLILRYLTSNINVISNILKCVDDTNSRPRVSFVVADCCVSLWEMIVKFRFVSHNNTNRALPRSGLIFVGLILAFVLLGSTISFWVSIPRLEETYRPKCRFVSQSFTAKWSNFCLVDLGICTSSE